MSDREIMCESCCNFDSEHVDMGGNAFCKAIGIDTYSENYAGDCIAYNVTKEQIVVLPCAVGDTVWMVIDNRDFKRRMKDYCLSAEELPDLNIAEHNFSLLLLSSMGETVFLTKEEAEAKLKELEDGSV